MKKSPSRILKLTALSLVAAHFLVVVLHSAAHEILSVKASDAQLAFIFPVIIVAPVAAAFLLLKHEKAGALLLTVSLAGSFFFGLYYHFVARTHDHVEHVAALKPALWASLFQATAYLLVITEELGAVVGLMMLSRFYFLKKYAARTDF